MSAPTNNQPWRDHRSSPAANHPDLQLPPLADSYGWSAFGSFPSMGYSSTQMDTPYVATQTIDSGLPSAGRLHASGVGATPGPPFVTPTVAMSPPPRPRKSRSNPRQPTITQAEWQKHEGEIKRLWFGENKTLPETMKIMQERFQFNASEMQYKKQFTKWGLSKYLPAQIAVWMQGKAAERREAHGKETQFEFRGQMYTEDTIRQRLARKKDTSRTSNPALDASTPNEIKYTTPRNDAPSPMDPPRPPLPTNQSKWTPPTTSDARQPLLALRWNGFSKTNFDARFQEALEEERMGHPDEAEKKFRDALTGLDNLLSSTNPDTKAVAYRLASFYAKHDRANDADAVLDWITKRHVDSYGLRHSMTIDHLLKVVDMLGEWSRSADATTYLQQILDAIEKQDLPDDPQRVDSQPTITTSPYPNLNISTQGTGSARHQPDTNLSGSSLRSGEPTMAEPQPTSMDTANEGIEETEDHLLRLVERCEEVPGKLSAHAVRCRIALLDYYKKVADEAKMNNALDQAEKALSGMLESEQQKTEEMFEACINLTKCLVRAGRHEVGDDMFVRLQFEMMEIPTLNESQTISFLERIGSFYQGQGMWARASSRFQQALNICYAEYGEHSEHAKHLETALEIGHYDVYTPKL